MFFCILLSYSFSVVLNCYYVITDLSYHLSLNHFIISFVESQFTNLISVWILCHIVYWIILASDLMLFDHLISFTADYENIPSNCCCSNTVLKLYHKCCNENFIFLKFPFLFIFDKYLYISDFVWRVVSWVCKVTRRPWDIILELKNSLKFIELLILVNWLPRVNLDHKEPQVLFSVSHHNQYLSWCCLVIEIFIHKRYKFIFS